MLEQMLVDIGIYRTLVKRAILAAALDHTSF